MFARTCRIGAHVAPMSASLCLLAIGYPVFACLLTRHTVTGSPHRSSWIKTLQFKEQSESDLLKCRAPGEPLTDRLSAPQRSTDPISSDVVLLPAVFTP